MDHWGANSWNFPSRVKEMAALKASIPSKPSTFSEKVRFRMAYDRKPILKTFADKYHVRDFVKTQVGERYLATVLDVAQQAKDIKWELLPTNFVCKTNHGSGGMVGVWDGVELEAELPQDHSRLGWTRWWVNPLNFDADTCVSMMNYWLKENYAYRRGTYPEWAYSSIDRRIYIEELLLHADGRIASPIYFYVFSGTTKFILITDRDKDTSRMVSFSDEDWNPLDVGNPDFDDHKPIIPFPERPQNFEELRQVAEKLSHGLDFARVDLYNIDGRIVFSEITNYPAGGGSPWQPAEFEMQLGQYWRQSV